MSKKALSWILTVAMVVSLLTTLPIRAYAVVIQAPIISGQSIWRDSASAANVRFMSSEAATYYYRVTDNDIPPSTEDLSGWTTGAAIAADTTVTFSPAGLTTGEQYVYIVAKDGSGNTSNLLSLVMPYDYYYYENFETYPLDTSIASNAMSPLAQRNAGSGSAAQKVILEDPNKMLSLTSNYNAASDQHVLLDSSILASSDTYVFEGDVYPLLATGFQLRFSFANGNYESNNEAGVFFSEGKITTTSNSDASDPVVLKDSYTANAWHHVKIVAKPASNQYEVYMDGDLLSDTLPLPSGIDRLALSAGNNADNTTVYYDNLMFYAVPEPAVCEILGTSYSSLAAALDAVADEQTIQLLADITYESGIVASGKSFAIDVNDYTLTMATTDQNCISAQDGYSIYITDDGTSEVSGAFIANASGGYSGIEAYGTGQILIEVPAVLSVTGDNAQGIYTQGAREVFFNGDITVTGSSTYGIFAQSDTYGSLITIDGEVNSDNIIRINETVHQDLDDCTTPTTKTGYLTFVDPEDSATDPRSTVWLKTEEETNWIGGITSESQYPFGGGDGSSEEFAYEISTANQLAQLAYNVNNGNDYTGKYFKLVNDLNLAAKQWTPIGHRFYPGYENGFNGSFDGNNHSINNLTIGSASEPKVGGEQTQAGLFGAIKYQATLKNIKVTVDIYTDGVTNVGGLLGYSESNGTISNCSADGSLTTKGEDTREVGGLIGHVSNTSILECSSNVSIAVETASETGGLIGSHGGYSFDKLRNISNSIFTGTVDAGSSSYTGGITGTSYGNTFIVNAVNTGSVTASRGNVGGIAGKIHNKVANCYNVGSVGNSGNSLSKVGGIVAFIDSGYVKNCYNAGPVSNPGGAIAGALVADLSSYDTAANLYSDITLNPSLDPVNITNGTSYYLYNLTTEEMKGAAPSQTLEYAEGLTASGIVAALNGWIDEFDYSEFDITFAKWDMDSSVNSGYAFLEGVPLENNAELDSLLITQGTLSPAFSKEVGVYEASVPNSTDELRVTAIARSLNASISINGETTATRDIQLATGNNTLEIVVTAENGVTTNSYTVNITRAVASSSGGRSSNTAPTIVVVTEAQNDSTTNTTALSPDTVSGIASATVSTAIVEALLDKITSDGGALKNDRINLVVEATTGTNELNIDILQINLARIVDKTDANLSITSPFISITFDEKALDTIVSAKSGGTVVVSAGIVDNESLTEADKAKIKGRPVYDLTVMNGDTQISHFNGGHATVTIPYELQAGENPNAVVVYFMSDDGKLMAARGHYHVDLKAVVFKTSHFSKFVIGNNPVPFMDVVSEAWYKEAVDFIAARGITSGTAEGVFSPETKLTRGQFIVLLMNAYGISPDVAGEGMANFVDAGNTYYTDYLLAAKSLGIVSGVGNNMFEPEEAITRQEMFVMLYNALEGIEELPQAYGDKQLSDFDDVDQVASWAHEAMSALIEGGVISGSHGLLKPAASTSRAEMAQILYNLLSK
ncbi:MAG: hypothetical protein AVO33_09845 [delta proteobacterium ML8_F1]|nr:MAG: hypothetical protein AVO33_09845 [delta proteobacterium ML8_F1]